MARSLLAALVALAITAGAACAQTPNPIPQPRVVGTAAPAAAVGTPVAPHPATAPPRPTATDTPRTRLLFAGDSISTYPWPDAVTGAVNGVRLNGCNTANWSFACAAVPGNTLMDISAHCPPCSLGLSVDYGARVAPYDWQWLVVEEGRNDAGWMGWKTLDDWRAAWQTFYALDPNPAQTVATGMPYVPASLQPLADQMDAITRQEAARVGAHYAPLVGMTLEMTFDGVHPNADGNAFIAARVLAALTTPQKGR